MLLKTAFQLCRAEKFLKEKICRRKTTSLEKLLGYPAKNFRQVCHDCLLKFRYNLVRKLKFWWTVSFFANFFGLWIKNLGLFAEKISLEFLKLRFTSSKNHSGFFFENATNKNVSVIWVKKNGPVQLKVCQVVKTALYMPREKMSEKNSFFSEK